MIKIGVIGGGLNSAVGKAHMSAIALTNRFSVETACFSRNKNVNKATADAFSIRDEKLYLDYTELIDKEKSTIDAVLILTPTNQHKDQVIYALKAGLSVICEKSLTTSVEDALEIKKYLSNSGVSLFVIYNYLGYPMIKELRNMIQSGKLGNITNIQIEMPQEGFVRTSNGQALVPQKWRLEDHLIPTISLDLGVHLHMIIRYLTGEKPLRTMAMSRSLGNFHNIIDDVNALIEFTNGLGCNMWYSKSAVGHRNGLGFRIYGTKGSAFWLQTEPEIVHYSDIEGRHMLIDRNSPDIHIANSDIYNRFKGGHPAGFIEALANYYYDLAEKITSKQQDESTKDEVFGFSESLEGLQLFQAIANSSEKNFWEDINLSE
jgi:predicted dehydrogenase